MKSYLKKPRVPDAIAYASEVAEMFRSTRATTE